MRILLVEDDRLIGTAIEQALKDASYALDWVQDGLLVESAVTTQDYTIILLDLGLPNKNGFELLRWLRTSKHSVPVIIITARDDIDNRIEGLDLGADDYLVKPFSISELQARIRAVVRRKQGSASSLISNSDMTLNIATCEITRDDKAHQLSAREFTLLRTLMMRAGKVFSREELEEQIYGWNEEIASNAIEVIIHGLRKKLGKDTIKNIRGLGWMVNK